MSEFFSFVFWRFWLISRVSTAPEAPRPCSKWRRSSHRGPAGGGGLLAQHAVGIGFFFLQKGGAKDLIVFWNIFVFLFFKCFFFFLKISPYKIWSCGRQTSAYWSCDSSAFEYEQNMCTCCSTRDSEDSKEKIFLKKIKKNNKKRRFKQVGKKGATPVFKLLPPPPQPYSSQELGV